MTTKIFPMAEQINLDPNLIYNKLIEKFDYRYIFRHIKRHLTLDELRSEFIQYRKEFFENDTSETLQTFPWNFGPFLKKKDLIGPKFNDLEVFYILRNSTPND